MLTNAMSSSRRWPETRGTGPPPHASSDSIAAICTGGHNESVSRNTERTEIDAVVLERLHIQCAPGFDQRNGAAHVLRPVQTDHRIDSTAVDVERQETPGI